MASTRTSVTNLERNVLTLSTLDVLLWAEHASLDLGPSGVLRSRRSTQRRSTQRTEIQTVENSPNVSFRSPTVQHLDEITEQPANEVLPVGFKNEEDIDDKLWKADGELGPSVRMTISELECSSDLTSSSTSSTSSSWWKDLKNFKAKMIMEIGNYWTGWKSRNVPKLKDLRPGVQMFVIYLLTTPPIYLYNGKLSVVLLCQSALKIYEKTGGGALKKAFERISGSTIAIIVAAAIFIPPYYSGLNRVSDYPWLHWIFYAVAILSAFMWAYISYHFPLERFSSLTSSGLSTSLYVFALTQNDYITTLLPLWGFTVAGVIIGSLVYRFVCFKSAREALREDLSSIFSNLGEVLKPLIELEAGLVRSTKFFKPKKKEPQGVTSKLTRMVTRAIDKARRRSSVFSKSKGRSSTSKSSSTSTKSTGSTDTDRSTLGSSVRSTAGGDIQEIEYEIFETFKDELWSKIDHVWQLLSRQESYILYARTEILHKKARFRTEEYRGLLVQAQRVYSHVNSLHLVLENYGALAQTSDNENASFCRVLQGKWDMVGTVKIARNPQSLDAQHMSRIMRYKTVEALGTKLVDRRFDADETFIDLTGNATGRGNDGIMKVFSDGQLDQRLRRNSFRRQPQSKADEHDQLDLNLADATTGTRRRTVVVQQPNESMDLIEHHRLSNASMTGLQKLALANKPVLDEIERDHHWGSNERGGIISNSRNEAVQSDYTMLENEIDDNFELYERVLANPVIRWAKMFGPHLGRISRHTSAALLLFGESLKDKRIHPECRHLISQAEKAIVRLVRLRREWQLLFELLFNEFMAQQRSAMHGASDERRNKNETDFMTRIQDLIGCTLETWMGVTLQEFSSLPVGIKNRLWSVFWNIEDRLTATNRILIALLVEIKATIIALERWSDAMGWQDKSHRGVNVCLVH